METPDKKLLPEQETTSPSNSPGQEPSSSEAKKALPKSSAYGSFIKIALVATALFGAFQLYNEREYWMSVWLQGTLFPATESADFSRLRGKDYLKNAPPQTRDDNDD